MNNQDIQENNNTQENNNKQENTKLTNKDLFIIFHNNYDGEEIKKILESEKYDITNENIYDGKNILFALGCNFNLQEYYPLLEEEYKKLGKNIRENLNKLDNEGNSVLLYAMNIISEISKSIEIDDKEMLEDKCFDNVKFLVEQGCNINIEINGKNYLDCIYSNQIIKNFKKYSLKLSEYFIKLGLKLIYNDNREHYLIYGACEYNHLELLTLLLDNGVDKNVVLRDSLLLLNLNDDIKNKLEELKNTNKNEGIQELENNNKNKGIKELENNKNDNEGIEENIEDIEEKNIILDNDSIFQKRLNRLKNIRLRTGKAVYNNNLNNQNNNKIVKNNSISRNLNDLNKEERLKVLREEYLKTDKFRELKIKMNQVNNSNNN